MALLLTAVVLVGAPSWAQASPAETQPMDSPRLAGFVMTGVTVTNMQAGWTVPTLDCKTTPNGEASILISVGKAGQANLVSIGMTAACEHRAAVYSSWYKIPGRDRSDCPGGPPERGDHVRAEIDASRNIYLRMTDCASIMTDQSVDQLTSASILVRATRNGAGQPIEPLADFGTVYVKTAQVNRTPIAQGDSINWRMVSGSGTVRAVTSGLHDDGSFAVNWRAPR